MLLKAKTTLLVLGDIAALYIALSLTLIIRYGFTGLEEGWESHFYPFTIVFILWLVIFFILDLYSPKTFKNRLELTQAWSVGILAGFVVSIVSFYIFSSFFGLTPKTNLIIFTIIFGALSFFWRSWHLSFARTALWQIKFIMLGDSENARELMTSLENNPGHGYRKELWLKDFTIEAKEKILTEIKKKIELLVIHPTLMKNAGVTSFSYELLPAGIQIKNFTDFYEEIFRRVPLEDLSEDWFIKEINVSNRFYNIGKRIFDLTLSLTLLITLSPLFLLIAILVRASSVGPVIFRQTRIGRGDREFTLYKFRTMVKDAEKNGAQWTTKGDTRITPLGHILRHTHLDEMPQLWNILSGDISFVGPRPESLKLVHQYKQLPHYSIRHIIRPGLTGWAQINFRPSASLEEAQEKLKYDLYYIRRRSFALDLMIILKTARMIFKNY